MGLLPLEFMSGEGYKELGLDGSEEFSFAIDDSLQPRQEVTVTAKKTDGSGAEVSFKTRSRIDTNPELESFQHGGILPKVLRKKAVMPKAMP